MGFGFLLGKAHWSDVTQGTVWTYMVILPTPVFQHHPGLSQRPELFPVQALLPQTRIEAFDVTILPRAARINIKRLDSVLRQPVAEIALNKLTAVITPDVFRGPVFFDEAGHDLAHFLRVDPPVDMDAQTLPGMFVYHVKHPEVTSTFGSAVYEVPCPHMVAVLGPCRHPCRLAPASRARFTGLHWQAEFTAQSLHQACSDFPALRLQQAGYLGVAPFHVGIGDPP